jgi:TolB-like protein
MYFYPKYFAEKVPLKSTVADKSIAILPFDDKSPKGDQEWYSDGIMEEVRNYLVQVQNLRISSGTETMDFKDSDKLPKEIGEELGVAYVLAGSVMRLDNNIKINLQLIDVSTGEYRWAESYDQELTGVFSILSEVAQKVASTLDAKIQSQLIERMEQMPTENMEAYDLYLKASSLFGIPSIDNPQENIDWLNQALQLDSNFASSYALLGNSILFQAGFSQNKNPKDVREEGKAMIEKALLLDPLDAMAHLLMGSYSLWYEKDFNKAEINYLICKRIAPSDASTYSTYMDLLLAEGRFQEAIPIGTKLIEIASNNPGNWGRAALLWAFNDEEEKMYGSIKQARKAPANNILAYTESARALLIQKQYNQVLEILDLSSNAQAIPRSMGLKSIAYYQIGDIENHNKALDSLIQRSTWTAGGSPSFYTAMVYASKGNTNESFKWLEKSYQDNEIELYWLKVEPEFESLHDNPRWQVMLDKVGFPD